MTLDYGNYGIVLIIGNAGFIPSTVVSNIGSQVSLSPASSQAYRALYENNLICNQCPAMNVGRGGHEGGGWGVRVPGPLGSGFVV